jgi:hypothetical protein
MNYDKRIYIRLGKVEERNRLPVEVATWKKLPPGKSCHPEKVATRKKLPPGKSCHPVKVAAR